MENIPKILRVVFIDESHWKHEEPATYRSVSITLTPQQRHKLRPNKVSEEMYERICLVILDKENE